MLREVEPFRLDVDGADGLAEFVDGRASVLAFVTRPDVSDE
jgi:hypothetical protein